MNIITQLILGLGSLLAETAAKSQYTLHDIYDATNFFDKFTFETFDDPNHGYVNYVDRETAFSKRLAFELSGHIILRVDPSNIVPPGSRGRNSIYLTSTNTFLESLIISDINHMPWNCGVWPTFGTRSKKGPFPHGGEIDIIEGVNTNSHNLMSLHTTPNCTISSGGTNSQVISTNCDAGVNFNQGCGQTIPVPNSYGRDFNANGGGVYATELTSNSISIWFFPRLGYIPADIASGMPDPSGWGPASASFNLDQCNFHQHFNAQRLFIRTDLCGDWAGNSYPSSGCPSTCEQFVSNNPRAFVEAYWEVLSIKVYEKHGNVRQSV